MQELQGDNTETRRILFIATREHQNALEAGTFSVTNHAFISVVVNRRNLV